LNYGLWSYTANKFPPKGKNQNQKPKFRGSPLIRRENTISKGLIAVCSTEKKPVE